MTAPWCPPTLAGETARRLQAAGYTWDSPEIIAITEQNRRAAQRRTVHVEQRRGQFGKTIESRLDANNCGWPTCPTCKNRKREAQS